jgi:hypothetical protein
MRRLPALLAESKSAEGAQLNALEQELDTLSEWLSAKFISDSISADEFRNAEARVTHLRTLIEERRASARSGSDGRANTLEPVRDIGASPPLQLEDTGVLYRLPDRQRERPVIIDNMPDRDAGQPERLTPPSAAA